MKTKLVKAITLAVAAVFLISSVAFAVPPEGEEGSGKQCGRGEKIEKLKAELGLTPEQSEALKAERTEFKDKNKELRTELRAKRTALKDELQKDTINRAVVDNIINDIANLQRSKLTSRVDKIVAMKSILTPEQFKKLQAKMHEKMKERKGGKGKGHGEGNGHQGF
ncbi:Spy/CpxP family protein refolding chaperone [Candidatus Omnitrophota bacterium]